MLLSFRGAEDESHRLVLALASIVLLEQGEAFAASTKRSRVPLPTTHAAKFENTPLSVPFVYSVCFVVVSGFVHARSVESHVLIPVATH